MTIVAPSGTITLVVTSEVFELGTLFDHGAGRLFGVDLHPDHPVVRDERAEPSRVPVFRNCICCTVLVRFWVSVCVAEPLAELDLGPLLVEDEHPRAGQHVDLADVSRAWMNPVVRLLMKAVLEAVRVAPVPKRPTGPTGWPRALIVLAGLKPEFAAMSKPSPTTATAGRRRCCSGRRS